MLRYLGLLFIMLSPGTMAQQLIVSVQDTVCVNENLTISNTSIGIDSVQWDFCPGDLANAPQASTSYNIPADNTGLDEIQTLFDGSNYYAFVLSTSNSELYRITVGDSLTDAPSSFDDLGNVGSLSNPRRISGISEGGSWNLFISNFADNSISRVDFGPDLSGTVQSSENLGNILGELSGPFGIEALEINGSYYLIVGNHLTKTIKILDYGNTYSNTPSLVNSFTASADLGNISALKSILIKDKIYLAVCGQLKAFIYDFEGNSLSNSPTLLYDLSAFGSMSSPRGMDIAYDNGDIFLNFMGFSGDYYSYQFDRTWNFIEFNNYGVFSGLTDTRSLDFNFNNSEWVGFSINKGVNKELFQVTYENECQSSVPSSSNSTPTTVVYDTIFWKFFTVDGFSNGFRYHHRDSVFVKGLTDVDFTSSSTCQGLTNFFSSTSSAGNVIVNYSWDFGDPGSGTSNTSTDQNPTHSYNTPGDYDVLILVTDECGVAKDTTITITIFDQDDMNPGFEATSAQLCPGNLIQFNDTTTFSQDIPQSWAWYVDEILVSNDQNPLLTFLTNGFFDVRLEVTGLSTCTKSVQEIVEIDGPISTFSPSSFSICEGESISFTDQSTSSPVSWQWDFDDGFTSSSQHPDHLFATPGNYNVALTVTDALGCENTLAQEVSVSSLPSVSFDFDVPCTSSEGIQFMDLSTVSGADIVSRTWYVGDTPLEEVQDQQNPLLGFGDEGTVTVRLEIQSSNGCTAAHSEDIQVLTAPQPDFAMDIGCEGESSLFTDLSASPGNQVTSWLWMVDGASYVTQDINHTFSGPGMFDVTLEVTSQNFCSETITKSIEVLELLTADFNTEGDCSNELITLADQTIELQDPIVSREWFLDGASVGNGSDLILESLPENTYEVSLEVTTAAGCVVSSSNEILINNAPQSVISAPKTYGVPGDAITFTNQSIGGSAYQWLFNGVSASTNGVSETFVFQDPGTYQIGLVADNDLGCSDTTATAVLIAIPSVDLSIGQFEIVENNRIGTIFLEIQNNSNLPIDDTEVVIELENQISVTQQIQSLIGIGESRLVNINLGIQLDETELLCVTVNSQYTEFNDRNPLDNEKCLTIEPKIVVEAPFPNPVTDQVRVRLIAPTAGIATITLLNSVGKVEMTTSTQTQAGLNNFFLDLKALNTGVYFIRLEIASTTSVQRIIKL